MSQTLLESSPLPTQSLEPLPLNPTLVVAVRWAVRRQTKDFSPSDIIKTLAREGCYLRSGQVAHGTKILRDRGELETIVPARGRNSPVFRCPGHMRLEQRPPQESHRLPYDSGTPLAAVRWRPARWRW